MKPTTMGATVVGMMRSARTKLLPLRFILSKSAIPSPSTNSMAVAEIESLIVLIREATNVGSLNAFL
jgi:hypothetical protein